ncbi:MAG: hypothetical protein EBT26_09945 [Microbacteriaceae bacterium]|nr:hypothetical protein [Microbacteriaceae bacterium]NBS62336.1 hypothetical protein [Microbacteriaceae bacterium]
MFAKGEAPLLPLLLCEKLGISFSLEQSIRISRKGILQGRYVVGIAPNQLDTKHYSEFLNCLSLPHVFLSWAKLNQKRCSTLGIGFEPSVNGTCYKLYFEYRHHLEKRVNQTDKAQSLSWNNQQNQPFLALVGLKWLVDEPDQWRLTHYKLWPELSHKNAQELIFSTAQKLWPNTPCGNNFKFITDLAFSAKACPPELLIVNEKNSSTITSKRQSLDICLHQSDLNLSEVSLPIGQIALTVTGNNHANPSNFALWNPEAELTHVSLGADALGEPFVSIYFR